MGKEVKTYPLWSKPLRLTSRYLKKKHALHVCENSLVHGPNYFLPSCADSGIITVHDLSIYRYPETHPAERIKQFDKNFVDTLKRTKHIITDSVAMKSEIIELLGWSAEKISVVLLGVSSEFVPRSFTQHDFLQKYRLRVEGYTLCVATIEPRKNIDKLVAAYKVLPKQLREGFPLVIIGGIGWKAEEIMVQIEEGVREGWIIQPGFVSNNELLLFYQHAKLFVYPSAYEGFGLPVAEAMACGIPIVASDRTSTPEVTQNTALLVNPDDIKSFESAIDKGINDDNWRINASLNSLKVAKDYTWENSVRETIKIYKNIGM
jgi:alpha-1,3-rhamnosyl/mannosyltransferase